MKNIISKIEVEISNIKVDDEYYYFNYKVTQDGKVKKSGIYEDDYDNGDTPEQWKKRLEKGVAVELVIISAFE